MPDSTAWSTRRFGSPAAPTVVLLHAVATSSEIWLPQAGPWSRRLHCVLVDLPGHGTTRPDIALRTIDDYADRLMQEIASPALSIVGLSLGGMIAQACAIRHPKRVKSVVIANSVAKITETAFAAWDARLDQVERAGMQSQLEDTLTRWFTPSFRSQNPLMIDWIGSLIERTHVEGYRTAVQAIQRLDNFDRLSNIRCPAMVITGSDDPTSTPEMALSMATKIGGARHCILQSAAHLSNVEQPVRFSEAVGKFLNETCLEPA